MVNELHLYPKRAKLLLGAIGSAGTLLVIGVSLYIGPAPDASLFLFREPLIFYIMFSVVLLIFGYLFSFAVRNLVAPRPWAILTPDGVAVDGISYKFGAPWEAFEGFSILRKRRSNTFVLRLKDPHAFIDQQPAGRTAGTARALITRFGSPFLIDMGSLDANQYEVANFLDAHLPQPAAEPAEAQNDRPGDAA